MAIPLDGDGFLRRECPTCEREFKWLHSEDSEPAPAGGYFCPYCGVQAPANEWLSRAQVELVQEVVACDIAALDSDGVRAARSGGPGQSNVSHH